MRAHLALVTVVFVLGACAGSPQVYEVTPEQAAAQELESIELPDVVPAVPAFALEVKDPLTDRQIEALDRTPGTAIVVPVAVEKLKVDGLGKQRSLTAAAVDPITFRSVAPLVTKDAEFVWASLLGGDAVLTHDAAADLGLGDRNQIELDGLGTLWVGAIADNGTPNLADLLVDSRKVDPTSWASARIAVIGAESGVTLERLARALKERIPGAHLRRIAPKGSELGAPTPALAPVAPIGSAGALHPTLAASVQQLLEASDGRVWFVSGYRTYAHQYQLWAGALQRYDDPELADNWVAPPGHSMHERGLAVDLGGDVEYAARLIGELGLPMWRPMSWEPWHFELVGSRG